MPNDAWAGQILWVDLTNKEITKKDLPEELAVNYLGQSGINAKILYDSINENTRPFDPENPLIFGTGPLTGTLAPCSGRYTVTSLSPLTNLFGDANSGGHFGPELKYSGFDHIVITGSSEEPVYLWINEGEAKIKSASHLKGLDTWKTEDKIKAELGQETAQVACIGPAGENLVRFAAVINNKCRAAGRTGMGAVMGSKNLKAVVVKGSAGTTVKEPNSFLGAVRKSEKDIFNDPLYPNASKYGTTAITGIAQQLGFLPTRNFQQSAFEGADNLSGDVILDNYTIRHKGCFNCPVSCSRFYKVEDGEYSGTFGEGPEYESISALGSKCGNDNLPSILNANTLCNKLGLDTISSGNMVAWAMECREKGLLADDLAYPEGEVLEWGNHRAVVNLIKMIANREGLGDILAEGGVRASERIGGKDYLVHSKGLDYPAVDVRGTKGMALSFAASPRGGDHLKGLPLYEVAPDVYKDDIKEELDIEIGDEYWKEYNTKAELITWHENWHCVVDSLGLCKLEGIALKPLKPRHFVSLYKTATGMDITEKEMEQIGERIYNLEKLINIKVGDVKREDDLPPKRLLEEPIKNGLNKGEQLKSEDFNNLLDEYYQLRGWDPSGRPQKETLEKLNLA